MNSITSPMLQSDSMIRKDIGEYALLSDCRSSALVSSLATIEWACLPRFDSAPFFAALLGDSDHGFWSLAPQQPVLKTQRRYRPGTMLLETTLSTESGTVRITDALSIHAKFPTLIRSVQAEHGSVALHMAVRVRFDYGSIRPLIRPSGDAWQLLAGQDALHIQGGASLRVAADDIVSDFTCTAGEAPVTFSMSWYPSHLTAIASGDADKQLRATAAWWRKWSRQCTYAGEWREPVLRSLLVLKSLTFAATGAIIAAATTSIPEWPASGRNWDYRYVWLRDCAFTLSAFLQCGYLDEAASWRNWLERAIGVEPAATMTLYGVYGERRITEYEIDWLPGFRGSGPVRVGNAASSQFQLDIFGEVFAAFALAHRVGVAAASPASQAAAVTLLDYLSRAWHEPDEGIWEVRGGKRHFTHSKLMAWVAFDRAISAAQEGVLSGPHAAWVATRDAIHREICAQAFSSRKNSFVQSYGSETLDASLLLLSAVGFLPPDDARMVGTVHAIECELTDAHGLVRRYATDDTSVDGLSAPEGAFLPCSFWLVDALAMQGRMVEARRLFEHLLQLGNDLGLYSEEYDSDSATMLGNFPQAFTHVALVNSACRLSKAALQGTHDHKQI